MYVCILQVVFTLQLLICHQGQAIAFAKSDHLRKYGISQVLRCITKDIANLENVRHLPVLSCTYCTLLGTHFYHKSRRDGATRHNCMCLRR